MSHTVRDVNIALARCDLERVLGEHLRDGADPGRLLGELLEMCVNLRELADAAASGRTPAGTGVPDRGSLALIREVVAGESRVAGHPDFTGIRVRLLKPMAGLLKLAREHHVEREADADESLAHD